MMVNLVHTKTNEIKKSNALLSSFFQLLKLMHEINRTIKMLQSKKIRTNKNERLSNSPSSYWQRWMLCAYALPLRKSVPFMLNESRIHNGLQRVWSIRIPKYEHLWYVLSNSDWFYFDAFWILSSKSFWIVQLDEFYSCELRLRIVRLIFNLIEKWIQKNILQLKFKFYLILLWWY